MRAGAKLASAWARVQGRWVWRVCQGTHLAIGYKIR